MKELKGCCLERGRKFYLESWNPVKELKEHPHLIFLPLVPQVESGEGIERGVGARLHSRLHEVESGEGIESADPDPAVSPASGEWNPVKELKDHEQRCAPSVHPPTGGIR